MPTAGLKAEEVAISHRPAAGGTSSTGKQRLGQLAGWEAFNRFCANGLAGRGISGDVGHGRRRDGDSFCVMR